MRDAASMILLLVIVAASAPAANDASPTVHLFRSGEKELTAETQAKIAAWTLEFLKTANFNTANQAAVLNQTVAHIQEHYRETVRGDFLVVTYDRTITVNTVGGVVSVCEIVVGLNRQDQLPSALFTADPDGRIVSHEKYGAVLPAELQPNAPGAAH